MYAPEAPTAVNVMINRGCACEMQETSEHTWAQGEALPHSIVTVETANALATPLCPRRVPMPLMSVNPLTLRVDVHFCVVTYAVAYAIMSIYTCVMVCLCLSAIMPPKH